MGESFGSMLRRHRLAASLTQEDLAERGSLSPTAIAALERGRSRAPPMIMVIDDLHWADEATLALLAYLVRDRSLDGLAIVVTARPADLDPLTRGLLAELGREADLAVLPLEGLGGGDLAELVSGLIGSPVPPKLVQSVAQATEGNPFFAEEMTVHLVDTGMVVDADGGVVLRADVQAAGVPERVRDTVVKRLLSLSTDGMELLSVGSVIGREFDLSIAAQAWARCPLSCGSAQWPAGGVRSTTTSAAWPV